MDFLLYILITLGGIFALIVSAIIFIYMKEVLKEEKKSQPESKKWEDKYYG